MRKFLVFLVLFGGGLAVLAWLEDRKRPAADGGDPSPSVTTTVPQRMDPGVALGGRFRATLYDDVTEQAVLRVTSEDSRTRGGEDFLDRLKVELLDPDSPRGGIQATLSADSARLKREGSTEGFEPRHEPLVWFEVVEALFTDGLPFVPLTVKTTAAVADATDARSRQLRSEEHVTIESETLDASSVGFAVDVDGEFIELTRKGEISFVSPEGSLVRFSSLMNGVLMIHRDRDVSSRGLRLEAFDGAELVFEGDPRASLSAGHITGRGTETQDEGGVLMESLDADGNVVLRYGKNEFRGSIAKITLDENGQLSKAWLEGLPSADLELAALDPAQFPNIAVDENAVIRIEGATTLEVERTDRNRFEVRGPATIETQDVRLRSNGDVTGWMALDGASASFQATGGVVVEGERATLETAEFEMDITRAEDGTQSLAGIARGGARLEGTLEDGRRFSVTSPDRLQVRRDGERLRIVEGIQMEMAVDEPNGFRARADRVTDFDVDAITFTAEGNVELDGKEGRGKGDSLVSRGPDSFLLRGSREKKARYDGPNGWAEALVVETEGDKLWARGDVTGDIRPPKSPGAGEEARDPVGGFDRYELECDELFLERVERPLESPGELERRLNLELTGVRSVRVTQAFETTALKCLRLTGERVSRVSIADDEEEELESTSRLHAQGDVEGKLSIEEVEVELSCDDLTVDGDEVAGAEPTHLSVATGNVRFRGTTGIDFRGQGEILTFDQTQSGTLEAPVAGRVRLFGRLPSNDLPFRLTATNVAFSPLGFEATRPEITVRGNRARAQSLNATRENVRFLGDVRLYGTTDSDVPWTLDADEIDIEGRADVGANDATLSAIEASGNVVFRLGELVLARGDELVERVSGRTRLTGSPARIESNIASYEADWIEFDTDLQIITATGRGRVIPVPPPPTPDPSNPHAFLPQEEEAWTLDFLSSSTLIEPDSLIFILQEPYFQFPSFGSTIRSSWAIMWIDRDKWQELPRTLDEKKESPQDVHPAVPGIMGRFFGFVDAFPGSEVVQEIYFEGPVEALQDDDLVARVDAIYLNAVEGDGWLANATVNILGKLVNQSFEQLTVKADWLRHSEDGSLQADDATVTPCDFDEPHVKVVTGDLKLTPLPNDHFELDLKRNGFELYNLPRIPLPPISIHTNEKLEPIWPSIAVGSSARFGALAGIDFSGPAAPVSEVAESVTTNKTFDSRYRVKAAYLGSRGGLLNVGVELQDKKDFWFDLYTGMIPFDTGDDKGFVRVPQSDRSEFRAWARGQTSLQAGKSRLSLVYSHQTDAGVQSEFFEEVFVPYEQSETYLQWNRSSDETYVQATALPQTESFRPVVEELPSVSAFRGRSPIFHVGGVPVIHTGDVQGDYLARREGTDPVSPFGLPSTFPDGLGDQEVLRFDTTQTLEVPIPLGLMGVKLIPIASAQVTAWDRSVNSNDAASRFIAEGGARMATTLWKRTASGLLHQISPYVQYVNLIDSHMNGQPATFSRVEGEIFGNFLDLGARTRWGVGEGRSQVDVDLLARYASERSDGALDGWLPLQAFSRLNVEPFGQLFEVIHDGRFDIEAGTTPYSNVAVGTRFGEGLDRIGIQGSHVRGRDLQGQPLFEAASLVGFFKWTEKWEFEVGQSFSLLEDNALGFDLVIRRYGHDILLELELQNRVGEGVSFGFNVRPRLGYRPSRIGFLDW